MKFQSKFWHFLSTKCAWKCRLPNGVHFVSASMCWTKHNITVYIDYRRKRQIPKYTATTARPSQISGRHDQSTHLVSRAVGTPRDLAAGFRIGVWDLGFESCIQQRKTTCLLSIIPISLACARASILTTTNMYIAKARCESQLAVRSSGLNACWS